MKTTKNNEEKLNPARLALLIALPAVCAAACLCMGRMALSPREVLSALLGGDNCAVVRNMRLPRILLAGFVGAGLSVSGCVFQSMFSNPLATPDTLGVASGSSFGAALALLMGFRLAGVQIMAFLFGAAAILLTWLAGLGRRGHGACGLRAALRARGLEKTEKTVNILGATPLDFSVNGAVRSMCGRLEDAGWHVRSVWAMGSRPEELKRAGEACVNLVVSSAGLPAARALRDMLKTPFVTGTPVGDEFSASVLRALAASASDGECRNAFGCFTPPEGADTVIIGESVTSRSLAAAIALRYGVQARVICPLECEDGVLSRGDKAICAETDIALSLKKARRIIADPLYRPIAPEGAEFFDLPHEAFSGRMFRRKIPNLVEKI